MAASLPPLLYGATGYTGRLIAYAAAERGIELILAGRNDRSLAELAHEVGMEHRVFALDDAAEVVAGLRGAPALLNCAGPFTRTWSMLATACVAARVHYLDITGEIDVFEGMASLDEDALEAGITLLPGAGFSVVPSDCLAAYLKHRLPEATRLILGILATGRRSRGTASTFVEHVEQGGMVRRGGRLKRVPAGWNVRQIDFGRGPRNAISIPWGDVSTAWRSTRIPNIEVYARAPRSSRTMLRATGRIRGILRSRWVKEGLRWIVRSGPAGPDEEELWRGRSIVWGRVEDDRGAGMEARVTGPNSYRLTREAACTLLRRAVAGEAPPGFQTPSTAFGPDLVLELGLEREDLG